MSNYACTEIVIFKISKMSLVSLWNSRQLNCLEMKVKIPFESLLRVGELHGNWGLCIGASLILGLKMKRGPGFASIFKEMSLESSQIDRRSLRSIIRID